VNTEEDARKVCQVNYFGTVYLTMQMLPLIKDNGKIITVGSQMGKVKWLSEEQRARILHKDISTEKIDAMAEEFFVGMREKTLKKLGYPNQMYGMSKILINVWVCRVLTKMEDILKRGI